MTGIADLEADAVVALADLAGRSGGTSLEVGWLDDDPPHLWYATVTYKGAKVIVEDHDDPFDACDALASKILKGGTCTHCGQTIALHQSRRVQRCVWVRVDDRWDRTCTP